MWSKLLCQQCRGRALGVTLLVPNNPKAQKVIVRESGHMIPPTQYDVPLPRRIIDIPYVLTHSWEVIPLFLVTAVAVFGVFFNIVWATKNKVDVVYSPRSRENISRTMDLFNPTNHKLVTINQVYKPWPEMQCTLDAMTFAEKRAATRRQCFDKPKSQAA